MDNIIYDCLVGLSWAVWPGGEVRGCATLMGASEVTSETECGEVRGCATLMGASEVTSETEG